VLTEYQAHEIVTASESKHRDALKFGQSGEVNSKKGWAPAEALLVAPPNYSEIGAPQVELDRAVGEAFIQQPPLQRLRTKLIFDVRIDNLFLD